MTITDASIDWHDSFDNAPTLTVTCNDLPRFEDLRFERKGRYLFAETEGYVCFFYDDPSNHEGYGGRRYDLTMIDGSKETLVGPWSGGESGAAAAGFPMTYATTARAKARFNGNGAEYIAHYAINLLEPLWLDTIARFCPDAHVVAAESEVGHPGMSGEQNAVIGHGLPRRGPMVSTYLIARKGMTYDQSQAFKRVKRFSRYAHEVRDEAPHWHGDKTPAEHRLGHATYVNGLIAAHGLEQWCQPFDLANLPPLLPARPPEPPPPLSCLAMGLIVLMESDTMTYGWLGGSNHYDATVAGVSTRVWISHYPAPHVTVFLGGDCVSIAASDQPHLCRAYRAMEERRAERIRTETAARQAPAIKVLEQKGCP